MTYKEATPIAELVEKAQTIVIVQADNPDGDSLGSALALKSILGDLGKQTALYCGVEMPSYLRYLSGWDRVSNELPKQFDMSIIVDASTMTLFERLVTSGQKTWLASKPCVILDHHGTVDNLVPFAQYTINDPKRASAGELIYLVSKQLGWPLSAVVQEYIMTTILGDTQGLTNQMASSETYRIMADMIDAGVSRPDLEEKRREFGKMPPVIFGYKGTLIQHTEFSHDGQIATVMVPQTEINQYSPLYNPGPLIQNDMLQTLGVRVAIVFKRYDDGKVTGTIRCNPGSGIAAKLAEQFGGGGHDFASGFKQQNSKSFDEIKTACLKATSELLSELDAEQAHETV